MTRDDLYDDAARERLVDEPVKRVKAPLRTPFERDRARVVHSASLRRLAAKLFLSDGTVRNHLSSAIGKTGATNRAEAVLTAEGNGWL